MPLTSFLRIFLTRSLKPFVFRNTYSEILNYDELEKPGLYVHIPFCRTICGFCPYCKVLYSLEAAKDYKKALLKEIELVCAGRNEKKRAASLYFGGGTPALMIDDLEDIILRLKEHFHIEGGIGVELHPGDINERVLGTLKSAGVTMVSVGVQSFDRNCLAALGRKEIGLSDKFKLLREADFSVVDVDLIFGIPGQTRESLIKDIDLAFSLGATQISTYPFIDFTFADNKRKPMPEKGKKELLSSICSHLYGRKKSRTSVWTFSEEGTGRYSSVTRDSFLGFGVSAATLLKGEFKLNTFSIPGYIDRISDNKLPTSLTLRFKKRQRACYYLFWRCYSMEISPEAFHNFTGRTLAEMYGFELWLSEKLGFVRREGDTYRMTDKGAYYYHYIEQEYTTAYIDKMWNISRIYAFPEKITLR